LCQEKSDNPGRQALRVVTAPAKSDCFSTPERKNKNLKVGLFHQINQT
jgi:hypothetical protein